MKRLLPALLLFALFAGPAASQVNFTTPNSSVNAVGQQVMCQNASGQSVACGSTATPLITNSQSQYPSGATPLTASATGTTGAITATLAAAAAKTTYICGFYYSGTNATAANTATTVTVTGTITGTLNFGYPTLAAAATVPNTLPIEEEFVPCIAASAVNTAIVVNGPALGTGATLATATAWGYQL